MMKAELMKTMAPATNTIRAPLVAPGWEFDCMDALLDWVHNTRTPRSDDDSF